MVILISFAKIFLKSWFVSATSTTNNKDIIDTIESICKRDPLAGKTVTGGIITINDSAWQISFTINRQQQFKDQPENEISTWIYALYSDVNGDYIKSQLQNVVVMKYAKNGCIT